MNNQEVYHFVERYLLAQECQIVERGNGYLTTKLSVKADKDIGARPFYWLFQERTGAPAETLTLTFTFDTELNQEEHQRKGELLQFGSWRLHQIFASAKKHGQFVRLYEQVDASASTQALHPWLLINYKISLISDQKKDIFYPVGINLVTGYILNRFDSILATYRLTPKIPDYHYTMTPIFSLPSAVARIETHIHDFLDSLDKSWAKAANQRLDEEIEIIHAFYLADEDTNQDTLNKRLAEVEYYRPRITVEPINVGLIYLQRHP